ncbi:MAG: ABC transporter permease subunit [Clostridiales bacterium]|jgi:NitT/TauT family transport system permease protein|nr:ABC transporter permease subunit [Clostridiales bacterium]HOK81418.1 ABC transporter permease subunit [Clostridia bacterium]HOL60718.1 ABC transporter permease subunit [Clostridia bacterium]HPO53293.1 ABC transporter permease subunit [Clostridia bacterium]
MNKAKLKSIIVRFSPLITVGVFILIWYIAAIAVDIELILPRPALVFKELLALISGKTFWTAVGGTLSRSFTGFAISFALAMILAVAGFAIKPIHRAFSPLVIISRAIPTMSVILLSLIWLTSQTSPILISSLIMFPMFYSDFYSALNNIDKGVIDMAKLYKVGAKDIVTRLYIPNILPSVLDSVRSGISFNVKIVIAAEVLAQTRQSMGISMQISRVMLDTASLLAWTAAAVAISYALELIVELIKRFAVKWRRA